MCLCIIDRSCEAERFDHHCGEPCTLLRGRSSATKVRFKWISPSLIHCRVNALGSSRPVSSFSHVAQRLSLINIADTYCRMLYWIQGRIRNCVAEVLHKQYSGCLTFLWIILHQIHLFWINIKQLNAFVYTVCRKLGHGIKLFSPVVWPWLTHPPCTHTLSESLNRFSNPAIQYPSLYSLSPLFSSFSLFHPSFMKRFPLLLLISPSFVSLHILCPFHRFEITHQLILQLCTPCSVLFLDTFSTVWL